MSEQHEQPQSQSGLFEQLGLFDGTSEVRARGWALVQLVSGFFGTLVGVMLLITTAKKELKVLSEPYVTYKLSEEEGRIFNKPTLHVPSIVEVDTPLIPTWDAGLNVILGGGFIAMAILLLIAADQQNARKCTIWLKFTCPMVLVIVCRTMYKAYMDPEANKFSNVGIWAAFGYSIYIVYTYQQECIEFERTARIIKEREMD